MAEKGRKIDRKVAEKGWKGQMSPEKARKSPEKANGGRSSIDL
jgi:hypothetical protein